MALIVLQLRHPTPLQDDSWHSLSLLDIPPLSNLIGNHKATVRRLFSETHLSRIHTLIQRARALDSAFQSPDFAAFLQINCPSMVQPYTLSRQLASLDFVDSAYVESSPAQPPMSPFNPLTHKPDCPLVQPYLHPAPSGIDALFALEFPGGDGQGISFIDIEQGWYLDHVDLPPIRLISGINSGWQAHGTSVLGLILGQDRIRGIAPRVSAGVVSQWSDRYHYSTPHAILNGAFHSKPGGVLLIEAQTDANRPVEVESAVFHLIQLATTAGIIVVEAAGNGIFNLDLHEQYDGRRTLDRNSPHFQDSGAICVAASTFPHRSRLTHSNWGSRIDCFAQGEKVVTTFHDPHNPLKIYTSTFAGTSCATAIVAGAAASLQGFAKHQTGAPLPPRVIRTLLSHPDFATSSETPERDHIGWMPNLRKLFINAPWNTYPAKARLD